MNFQVTYFLECLSASFSKIPVSIGIAAVTLLIGLLVGTPIALIRVFHVKILDPVFTALIAVVKAIPVNLIILIAGLWFNDNFNGIAQALGLSVTVADVDKIYVAIWALSIAAIALLSESVRGALLSVDHGQYEAGYAVGLTGFQTFTRIIMPQAFLVLVPGIDRKYQFADQTVSTGDSGWCAGCIECRYQSGKYLLLLSGSICGCCIDLLGDQYHLYSGRKAG